MEFKMVVPNASEELENDSVTSQNYDGMRIHLVHEGKKLSGVWKYYGLLCNAETAINTHRYYCSLCLKEFLENMSAGFKASFSNVHNVSISTATGNLKTHLLKGHNVSTFPESEREKFDLAFVMKSELKKRRSTGDGGFLDSNSVESDMSQIISKYSLDVGPTEECSAESHSLFNCYFRLKELLKQRLKDLNSVTMLGEFCFNPIISCNYLKISVVYIDANWEIHNCFISYSLLESLSTDCLRRHYETVFNDFLPRTEHKHQIHLVSTKLLPQISRVSNQELCFVFLTHQLIAKHGLYSSEVFTNLLEKCLNIVSELNLASFPCFDAAPGESNFEYLNELADVFYLVRLDEQKPFSLFANTNHSSLSKEIGTVKHIRRVSVILYLFKFMQKHWGLIAHHLEMMCQSGFLLYQSELKTIEGCIKFLSQFEDLPDLFRQCNDSLIIVPILKSKMKEFCEPSHDDPVPAVERIKEAVLSQLDEYYPMSPLVKLTCILDPSCRDILDKEDCCQFLISKLRSCLGAESEERNPISLQIEFGAVPEATKYGPIKAEPIASWGSKKLKLLKSLKPEYQMPDCKDKYVIEVRQYWQHSPTLEESETPLLFWRNHSHLYPNLSVLAREFLAIPAYSVPPDTVVSVDTLKAMPEWTNSFKLNAATFVRRNLELLCIGGNDLGRRAAS